MGKRLRRVGGMQWPPRDAAEMLDWQSRFGSDLEIARALAMSRASVYDQRRKHGVAALPASRCGRFRERAPRARIPAGAIAALYAGRRYEDRAVRSLGAGVAVRLDAPGAPPRRRAGGS